MSDIPKLTKDLDLLAPKKAKKLGPFVRAVLLGGTALAGVGLVQGAITEVSKLSNGPVSITSTASPTVQSPTPAPLVLKPAGAGTLLAQHQSHVSHVSHRSHVSHHSSSF